MGADMPETRYTGHLLQTRTAAGALNIVLVAMLMPFLLQRLDWSAPGRTAGWILLTLLPLAVSFRCLRFLGTQEAQHSSPTPEMHFIFGVAISVPLALAAAALIVMNT
jgi:hypothetical protein